MAHGAAREARLRAEAFASRMPWLTAAEREELIRLYAEESVAGARSYWEAVSMRAGELRAEYTARYKVLRRRVLYPSVAALVCSAALCVTVLLLVRAH
ncbi:hypothetical protein ACQEVG_16910 [Streptomyces sp. CA-135486]|uniref:hypothetical protein n=1 Tax=Streptomyces sp. CA-135486 TaxID=3240049 RepID=UPI003D8DA021